MSPLTQRDTAFDATIYDAIAATCFDAVIQRERAAEAKRQAGHASYTTHRGKRGVAGEDYDEDELPYD